MAKTDPRRPPRALCTRYVTDGIVSCKLAEVRKLEELIDQATKVSLYSTCLKRGANDAFAPNEDCGCKACDETRKFDAMYDEYFPPSPAVRAEA